MQNQREKAAWSRLSRVGVRPAFHGGGAEAWEKGGIIKGIKRKLLEVKRVRY